MSAEFSLEQPADMTSKWRCDLDFTLQVISIYERSAERRTHQKETAPPRIATQRRTLLAGTLCSAKAYTLLPLPPPYAGPARTARTRRATLPPFASEHRAAPRCQHRTMPCFAPRQNGPTRLWHLDSWYELRQLTR
ncbi:hypothetical protein NPIL_263311 [Nephila pilipes]|uniref:Uncharacterized protein n=1 Tax=Nephila pilipes TaxID=299642 RepID=A0A8X6UV40_NEPPI|nr:hypothetical protein NPIL_263311 [Nephila pilipes]